MNHCHAKADRIITGQEYFKKSAAQIHSNIKAQTITESEDRCLHFLEETSLSQRLLAADIVKVRGDDNQESYEVGADGFCKVGHFELFLPQKLFSVRPCTKLQVMSIHTASDMRSYQLHPLAEHKGHISNFM